MKVLKAEVTEHTAIRPWVVLKAQFRAAWDQIVHFPPRRISTIYSEKSITIGRWTIPIFIRYDLIELEDGSKVYFVNSNSEARTNSIFVKRAWSQIDELVKKEAQ